MSLLDRIRARRGPAPDEEQRYSADTYFNDIYYPSTFQYNGITYPIGLTGTLGGNRAMEITNSLPGYTAAVLNCPPAFAAQDIRAAVVSQMRFTYRYRPWVVSTSRKPEVAPRREFSKPSLNILEIPWPGATTADLVSRMEWHAGLGGAAFVAYRQDPGEPHLQVLLTTGYSDVAEHAIDCGFPMLRKPYDAAALQTAIQHCLKKAGVVKAA